MQTTPRLVSVLRRLNALEGHPPAPWVHQLSPGELALEKRRLKALLPEVMLGHHERMVARGRTSLAEVRDGVCTACHLRLPRGRRRPTGDEGIEVCDHCGRFLVWPVAASVLPPEVCELLAS